MLSVFAGTTVSIFLISLAQFRRNIFFIPIIKAEEVDCYSSIVVFYSLTIAKVPLPTLLGVQPPVGVQLVVSGYDSKSSEM